MANLERIYTIPLRDAYEHPRNKRGKRAINIIQAFALRHMKADDVRVSEGVNSNILRDGIEKPPRRIKVRMVKGEDALVRVWLIGEEEKIKEIADKKKKESEDKKEIGSAFPGSEVREMEVKGRNLAEGVPRSFTISSNEILEALTDPLNSIVSAVKTALEQTPPELGADIASKGMVLTGGGALLRDIDRLLMEETGLPVLIADDPLTCVVRGSGKALERMDKYSGIFTSD